jgi:hypothetical protein
VKRAVRELGLVFVFLVGCGGASAATYYVSSSRGQDFNDGRSPRTPWKSIARVNRQRLAPGDRVFFRRGDVWRETLVPSSSGSETAVIIYGAYGQGSLPVLSGSDPISSSSWKRESEHLFSVARGRCPTILWRGQRVMSPAAAKALVDDETKWWFDRVQGRVFVWGESQPPAEVEAARREVNIENNDQSHVVYESLDLRQAQEGVRLYSWSTPVTDITVRDSMIATAPKVPGGKAVSAGVYVSVNKGSFSDIVIQNNWFIPHPSGLEHWGVYFVRGVKNFRIEGNFFARAGEDAVTVWHSSDGVIEHNTGGGNGENTIDVKDSHDIVVRGNQADGDTEYSIVVHGVDVPGSTYKVMVEANHSLRGGQGGKLSGGIALLFVHDCTVARNVVEKAYGEGILVHDAEHDSANQISSNVLIGNGSHQKSLPLVLQDSPGTWVYGNVDDSPDVMALRP